MGDRNPWRAEGVSSCLARGRHVGSLCLRSLLHELEIVLSMESMGLRLWGRMEGLGLEGAMDAKLKGPGSVVGPWSGHWPGHCLLVVMAGAWESKQKNVSPSQASAQNECTITFTSLWQNQVMWQTRIRDGKCPSIGIRGIE